MTFHAVLPLRARLLSLAALLAALLALAPANALGQAPQPPARAQLEAATYPVEVAPGGTVTLAGGKFEVAAAPGSASKVTASLQASAGGTIAGQPAAAVIIASSGGGSGTFFDLHVVDAAAKSVARLPLGDRVRIDALSLDPQGRIVVAGAFKRDTDPACCPSLIERRTYALQGSALVLVSTATAAIEPPRPAATGTGGVEEARGLGLPYAALVLLSMLLASGAARAAAGRGGSRPSV